MLIATCRASMLPDTQVTATSSASGDAGRVEQREAVVDPGVDVEDERRPVGHGLDASRVPSSARATTSSGGQAVDVEDVRAETSREQRLAAAGLVGEERLRRRRRTPAGVVRRLEPRRRGRRGRACNQMTRDAAVPVIAGETPPASHRRRWRPRSTTSRDAARRGVPSELRGLARVHGVDALAVAQLAHRRRRSTASMSASESRHAQPSRSASRRPTVVLPAPISPVTTTCVDGVPSRQA